MLILDLEKVQISKSKQQQLLQLFLDLFGNPDQVANKWTVNSDYDVSMLRILIHAKKYIATSFRPFCVPNITTNKLLILFSQLLKATWCELNDASFAVL